MGKSKKTGKDRLDKYYKLAKEQGYRSRAAFKLVQLNKKFNFLGKANTLIDLCAAPGSWLQVAAKFMPVSRCIIGVDLHPIKSIPGVTTLCQDITTPKCRSEISFSLKGSKADVVLHDGAPNVGASWIKDAYSQSELTLSALKLAVEFLVPDGMFITKVFRSGDYNTLLWVFHQLFKKVTATKPTASRNSSAEIFVVCEGFLAPKKIDPKLLDPRSVFKEFDVTTKTPNLFGKKKERPNKGGYQTDSVLLFRKCSVLQFIHGNDPVGILAENNQIVFEVENGKENNDDIISDKEEIKLYLDHDKTTDEIKECLTDLKVLGSKEFKAILKWRMHMREFGGLEKKNEEDEEKPEIKLTEEQKSDLLQQEMEDTLLKAEKKKKKKWREREKKIQKFRMRQGMKSGIEDEFDAPTDLGVFNLKTIRKQTDLDQLVGYKALEEANESVAIREESNLMDRDEIYIPQEEEKVVDEEEKEFDEEGNLVDEEKVRDRKLEEYLDILYDQYMSANEEYRKKLKRMNRNKERKEHALPEDLTDFSKFVKVHDVEDELEVYNEPPDNKLLLANEEEVISKKAALWFDSDIFENVDDDNDDEQVVNKLVEENLKKRKRDSTVTESTVSMEPPPVKKPKIDSPHTKPSLTSRNNNKDEDEVEEVPLSPSVSDDEDTFVSTNEGLNGKIEDDDNENDEDDNGFQEVPQEEINKLAEEFGEYDLQTKAEILSLGTLLNDPQKRAEVLEKSVNRSMFHDSPLPEWFLEDEKKFNKPHLPITKEMVIEYKNQMKAIDARTSKKVAEAQARKRKKFKLKLEKARSKTKVIVKNSELSEREKIRQIQKIYKGQLKTVKPQKVYVIKTKTVGDVPKGRNVRYKLVDPRLKKDKRGKKFAEERKKRMK